jgi:dihydropteroate synthase
VRNNQTKIVGILNITPDSFSDGGLFFSKESAILQTKKMLEDGADIIDIGAESTRPKSEILDQEEEWKRLEKILPSIIVEIKKFNQNSQKKVKASIDSYNFETIKRSFEFGVEIVNDVSGLVDQKIVQFIAEKNLQIVLMHNLAIHANPELIINPHINLIKEIINWAGNKILYLEKNKINKSQIIFDPGIGFSKNAQQSIRILKNIDQFRILGVPLYIGHSRKSFLDEVKQMDFNLENKELNRDEKTILISKFLKEKNVDFIRVHDVKSNFLI